MEPSEFPPIPPPQFVEYPRGTKGEVARARLRLLVAGYNGVTYAFLGSILLAIVLQVMLLFGLGTLGMMMYIGLFAAGCFALYKGPTKKTGIGLGWQPGTHIWVSGLIALGNYFCVGIVGVVIVQQLVVRDLKASGIKVSLFTTVKKLLAQIDQLD